MLTPESWALFASANDPENLIVEGELFTNVVLPTP
jgi:hypothetical protein